MARPVTVTISHDLGKDQARTRVDERFDALETSIAGNVGLNFEKHWEGDTLKLKAKGLGQKITGDVDVFPQHVRITVMLPGLLAGMAEALTGRLEKQGRIMLEDKSGNA
ncbi:hypothetical protein PB2503_08229 [Parvularcula bermudensis HTCC2503]|uniref:Polyhydroxyalkanoic acid system protein n=1 Tax=Parvularcula bermudensis (strain ATCC BAA-594 / HTCC2503 / KCTC 12087) TaxID=314260 RepID=E0TIB7_PARBH|nr:polyhydroxyalkanoic acid system family protein [Parvularcula bermudensis]ADM09701.1 hypothetical protein PB2503_08229 [Parvularcula bermudensis HTCC2503]